MSEEFKNMKFGCIPSPDDNRDYMASAIFPIDIIGLDIVKNIRITNFISKIYNQLNESTCVAYSCRGVLECLNYSETGEVVELSERFIFANRKPEYTSYRLMDFEGMCIRDALDGLLHTGVCLYKTMPKNNSYKMWQQYLPLFTKEVLEEAKIYKIRNYVRITSINEIKLSLMENRPVLINLPITPKFKEDFNEGITEEYAKKNSYGYHAVYCIGIKTLNNILYLECVNSYGSNGKFGGLFYIPFENYAIREMWGIVDEQNPKPEKPKYHRVQLGAYKVKQNCYNMVEKLKKAGFATYVVNIDGLFKIQMGAFSIKTNAENLSKQLKAKGFDNFITYY